MRADIHLPTKIISTDSSSLEESLSSSEEKKKEQTNTQSSPRMNNPPVARHGGNPASSQTMGSAEVILTSSPPALSRRGKAQVMPGVWISEKHPELKSSLDKVVKNNPELKGNALNNAYLKEISLFLLRHFEELKFDSPEDRFNFLKKIATNQQRLFAKEFHTFGVTDEAQKLELAKCCGAYSMENLVTIGLDKSSHLALAKFLSKDEEGAMTLALRIEELDIPRDEDRIALAKACVLSNNLSITGYIDNFNITDEFVILELALTYFKAYDSASSDYLDRFKLTNFEYQRKAVLAASKCVASIKNFDELISFVEHLTPAVDANDLLIELVIHFSREPAFDDASRKLLRSMRSKVSTPDVSPAAREFLNSEPTLAQLATAAKSKILPNAADPIAALIAAKITHRCELILNQLQKGEVALDKIFSEEFIDKAKNKMPGNLDTLKWMKSVCFFIQKNNLNQDDLLKILQPAIKKIAVLGDTKYCDKLTKHLLSLRPDELRRYAGKELSAVNLLPILLDAPIATPGLENYVETLPKEFFGNGRNQRRFIECILNIQSSLLPVEAIIKILKYSFPKTATSPSTTPSSSPSSISSSKKNKAGNKSGVKPKSSAEKKKDLLKEFNYKMQSLSQIRTLIEIDAPLTNQLAEGKLTLPQAIHDLVIDNLNIKPSEYAKFQALFESYRDPVTIITYLGSIRYNPAIKTLQTFVRALLEDRYPACRYENDPLLESLGKAKLDLWKTNVTQPFISKEKSRINWNLVFTDHHEDVVRMGTDVKGSCQRVDGESRLNRGLMGTTMDGKHKICVIKNEEGVIVGRAVLRLMSMVDPNQSLQPCLMLEKIYPTDLDEEETTQLVNFAKDQAERMDLGLLVSNDVDIGANATTATPCKIPIYSGKLAYPVYCDALSALLEAAYVIETTNDKPLTWVRQPLVNPTTTNSSFSPISSTSSSSATQTENV